MQPLESPTPLTVAALRMIICKRPVPPDDHLQEAGPSFWQPRKGHEKCIFEILHNVFWVSKNQISMKKIKIFTIAYGLRGIEWKKGLEWDLILYEIFNVSKIVVTINVVNMNTFHTQ